MLSNERVVYETDNNLLACDVDCVPKYSQPWGKNF